MITVVHKGGYIGSKGVYVGRPSILGNPFKIGYNKVRDGDRDTVIAKYKSWILDQIETNGAVRAELVRIKELAEEGDVVLTCWCAPLKCHADVIKDLVETGVV